MLDVVTDDLSRGLFVISHIDLLVCCKQDANKLSFRQRPILEDCFPASSKQYNEAEGPAGPLQVRYID